MHLLKLFTALCALVWTAAAMDDGLTDFVSWDSYSLTVNDSRVFVLYVSSKRGIGNIKLMRGQSQCRRVPLPAYASARNVACTFKSHSISQVDLLIIYRTYSRSSAPMASMPSGKCSTHTTNGLDSERQCILLLVLPLCLSRRLRLHNFRQGHPTAL